MLPMFMRDTRPPQRIPPPPPCQPRKPQRHRGPIYQFPSKQEVTDYVNRTRTKR